MRDSPLPVECKGRALGLMTVGAKVRKAPKKRKLVALGLEYLKLAEAQGQNPAKRLKGNPHGEDGGETDKTMVQGQ